MYFYTKKYLQMINRLMVSTYCNSQWPTDEHSIVICISLICTLFNLSFLCRGGRQQCRTCSKRQLNDVFYLHFSFNSIYHNVILQWNVFPGIQRKKRHKTPFITQACCKCRVISISVADFYYGQWLQMKLDLFSQDLRIFSCCKD